ncbi:MAG: sulfotransferase [Phycisphaeraceae bacterium]|nr:sulfotransferase [Phycisphaerales bacterium]MCB9844049.1 sulfotransferase [Phycisphaeraceae bacterium]
MSQAAHAEAIRALQGGDFRAAEQHCRTALESNPDDPGALNTLAVILSRTGRLRDACLVLERMVAADGSNPLVKFNLGSILQRLGRHRHAAEMLASALETHPDIAEAHTGLARSLNALGHHAEAAEAAERALWINAGHAPALLEMARAERMGGQPASARDRVAGAVEWESVSARDRARLLVELGRAHDALGAYDDAFDSFERACAVRAESPEFKRLNPQVHQMLIRSLGDWAQPGCAADWPASWAKAPSKDDPAFIVGFLRSGTTLLERIVGSHPRLATTDEALAIPKILGEIGLKSLTTALPQIHRIRALELQRVYSQFLRQTLADDLPDDARVVDKLALNIINLPIIRRVFAGSKVIVALRDPRDVVMSCLMQPWDANFTSVRFRDAGSIAQVYSEVMGLWTRYREVLGLDYAEVRYEQLVSDTEGESRRVIGFLGEAWDDDVLAYRTGAGDRMATTPGAEAVARPVYDSSIGRWKRYAHRMGPAIDAVAPFVASFGYETA